MSDWQDVPMDAPRPRGGVSVVSVDGKSFGGETASGQWEDVPMDQPAAQDPPVGRTMGQELATGTRSVVEGATGIPMAVGDAMNTLINYGIMGVNKVSGKSVPYLAMPSESLAGFFDEYGVSKDEGLAGDIQRGVAGAMAIPGGAMLSKPATAMGQALKSSLATQPTMQAASGATGAMGSQAVQELGGGPIAQTIGGVVGSMAPTGAAQLPSAGRRIIRGPNGAEKVAENIKTFSRAGTTPTVGQATERPGVQAVESFLARNPGSSPVIKGKAEGQADEIGAMIDEIAQQSKGTVDVGRSITRGVSAFVDKFKEKSGELYDAIDQTIAPGQQVKVSNTLATLSKLSSKIPGAPKTSGDFVNPRIAKMRGNIISDTGEQIAARREAVRGTLDEMKSVQGQIDDLTRKVVDQSAAEDIVSSRLGAKSLPGTKRTSLVIDELESQKSELSARLSVDLRQMLADDIALLSRGRELPYQALKELRTRVGYLLDSSELVSDIPKSQLKQVYGAISRDIEAGLPDEALPLLSRATKFYKAGQDRIDVLDNVISGKTYEKIYNAAVSETKDGPTLISKVLRSMPPATRTKMAHEFLRTMGKATAGKQSAAGDVFSTETFLTNWNKMNPQAKSALFSNIGPQYVPAMNSIAKVAENIRKGSKVFANQSGTQQALSLKETIGGSLVALLMGQPGVAAAGIAEPAIAYGAAKWMTNPNIVKWMAQNSRRPAETLPVLLNTLSQKHKKDPDVQDFVEELIQ